MQERPRTIHGMIHTKWPGCELFVEVEGDGACAVFQRERYTRATEPCSRRTRTWPH